MTGLIFSVLTLVAAAAAQYVSEAYTLQITGKTNTSIDGYAASCHAGAAIEGLCYVAGDVNTTDTYEYYYLNATEDNGTQGLLIWQLPVSAGNGTIQHVPSPLTLEANYGSNVGVPLFYPGLGYSASEVYVNVFENGSLYLHGGPDDRTNNATYPQPPLYFGNLTNWALCDQFTGGYYYYSIGWVYGTQPAQNPSCQAVDLTLVPVPAAAKKARSEREWKA